MLRSFTVLFEDYLPIRLAGRQIYAHLTRVMDEVRKERAGEMARMREVCPVRARLTEGSKDTIAHAQRVWDTLVGAALLQEAGATHKQDREGGVILFSQLIDLGIDRVLTWEGLVTDAMELERVVQQVLLQDEADIGQLYNLKKEPGTEQVREKGTHLEMTFAIFIQVLWQCTEQQNNHSDNQLLHSIE